MLRSNYKHTCPAIPWVLRCIAAYKTLRGKMHLKELHDYEMCMSDQKCNYFAFWYVSSKWHSCGIHHNICTLTPKPQAFLKCHLKAIIEIHVLISNISEPFLLAIIHGWINHAVYSWISRGSLPEPWCFLQAPTRIHYIFIFYYPDEY